MKRLTLLAVALTMVLGMAVNASAAPEVTVSGNMLVNAVWGANWDFNDGDQSTNATPTAANDDQAMWIRERLDLAFTAVANENLKGVIVLRSTRGNWGQGSFANASVGGGGANPVTDAQLGINQAYIDFMIPSTDVNVKAGKMPVALPAAVGGGSMIQDDNATAIMASTALTENVSLLAGWARFFDMNSMVNLVTPTQSFTDSQIDAWVVALPLTFEGFSASPFLVYSDLGENSVDSVVNYAAGDGAANGLLSANASKANAGDKVDSAWWAGSSFELSILDPFIFKADVNYGSVSGDDDLERDGWLFDIALEYTGFDFMNLEAVFAYTTGYDNDDNSDGRMPVMSDSWALGSFWFGGGLITGDDMGTSNGNMGFWALALSATGIQSFVEGLTHDAHIVYAQGTNEDALTSTGTATNLVYGRTLLEDDSMLELDFNTYYKIYDELTLYNGIGYVNLDAEDGAGNDSWANGQDGGDAWKFQLGLKYNF